MRVEERGVSSAHHMVITNVTYRQKKMKRNNKCNMGNDLDS